MSTDTGPGPGPDADAVGAQAPAPPETTRVPAWTLRPVKAAKKRARWPEEAEHYEADTRMRGAKRRRSDDPRPHAGHTCGGQYHTYDEGERGVYHRFECVKCALGKVLAVEHDTKTHQIKFACPACRAQTYHNPVGFDPRVLVPFDCDTIPVGRDGDAEVL